MLNRKYIGMDIHTETISIAVRNADGEIVMEGVVETKVNTVLQFIHGLRGDLHVTCEEGTWAAWLYLHSQIVGARSISWAECREKKKNLSTPSRGEDVS